jgi:hypothetical protein
MAANALRISRGQALAAFAVLAAACQASCAKDPLSLARGIEAAADGLADARLWNRVDEIAQKKAALEARLAEAEQGYADARDDVKRAIDNARGYAAVCADTPAVDLALELLERELAAQLAAEAANDWDSVGDSQLRIRELAARYAVLAAAENPPVGSDARKEREARLFEAMRRLRSR